MWTKDGPKVIEFNVRLGDPEAQVIAMRDDCDWGILIAKKLGLFKEKNIDDANVSLQSDKKSVAAERSVVGVVIASSCYPFGDAGNCNTHILDKEIFAHNSDDLSVFAASVLEKDDGTFCSGKGRVMTVVAGAKTFAEASDKAYVKVREIIKDWPEAKWRTDIAKRLIKEGY
jgi:phosphoribosylamine--glycine ligase